MSSVCLSPFFFLFFFVSTQRSAQRHRDLHRTMNVLSETVKIFGSPVKKGRSWSACEDQTSNLGVSPAPRAETCVSPPAVTRASARPSARTFFRAFSNPLAKFVPKASASMPGALASPSAKTALRASTSPSTASMLLQTSAGSSAKTEPKPLTSPLTRPSTTAPAGTSMESSARVSASPSTERDASPWGTGVPGVSVRSSARTRQRASSGPPTHHACRGTSPADPAGESGLRVPDSPGAKTAAENSRGPSPHMVLLYFYFNFHCHASGFCIGLCTLLLPSLPPSPLAVLSLAHHPTVKG